MTFRKRDYRLSWSRRAILRALLATFSLACLLSHTAWGQGAAWAWGYNAFGQLGNGTTTNSNAPVQVGGLIGVMAISGGESHSLALKSDGTVWAWGSNAYGQLGNGANTNSSTPVQVTGLTGATAVAAGALHSLAWKAATPRTSSTALSRM